jgi:ParB-like chromosome segregation protein Spo0J
MRNQRSGWQSNGTNHIAVAWLPIASLKLDSRNPRVHSAGQIKQIAQSIKTFGFNVPILIDANGNVVAGHGRILACKLLGWTEVRTISLRHLSGAQARAFVIADNRLSENSVWDERLLAEQLKELSLLDLDFALEDIGFDMGEIDLRIQGLETGSDDEDDAADAMPPSSGSAVTRAGDLWFLGKNRVYCGSAVKESAYVALMGNERAAMVITDHLGIWR